MRIYIIGNDGITLCRKASTTINEGEIAVALKEELHAARLSSKRLLVLWNALPGVGLRDFNDQRHNLDLHRFHSASHQEIGGRIVQPMQF